MIAFDCALRRPDYDYAVRFDFAGGLLAIIGPSGCGKSTTVNLLAGLERPARGRIQLGDTVLVDTERGIFLPPARRRLGLVFQDAQLFPHLSVKTNLNYGRYFTPKRLRNYEFDAIMDVLGIGHLLSRAVSTLSGGERQRVAIGRAMLASPRILLMDEPLASLDPDRKREILPFIEKIRDDLKVPIIYVSHAIEEVARLATQVIRLEQGKIVREGPPAEVLAPRSLDRAAERFEAVSILSGRVKAYWPDSAITVIAHPAGDIVVPGAVGAVGQTKRVLIGATNVTLAVGGFGNLSIRTALAGRIVGLESDAGPFTLCTVELRGGDVIKAFITRLAAQALNLKEGDAVEALVKSVSIDERGVAPEPARPQESR